MSGRARWLKIKATKDLNLKRLSGRIVAMSVPDPLILDASIPKGQESTREVATAFLKLGLTSFGGPIAHIAYFRREFVERRRWVDETQFGELLGLCQSIPGPASSQLGFSLGLLRAGWLGALVAFTSFTLPSALLLLAFAACSEYLVGPWGQGLIHGLKLVAVAVVAQGVLGMARALTPDAPRALMAGTAAALVAISANTWETLLVIAAGAALGPWVCRHTVAQQAGGFTLRYGQRLGAALLIAFGSLLTLAIGFAPTAGPRVQVAGAFYRAGALVFGGGHVVLPLLEQAVVDPGWIDNGTFLAGYGAAQAVPGPLFSIAAFLGDRLHGDQGGLLGATVSLVAIFLPGFLLVSGILPFWQILSARKGTARMLAGMNAVVVGLLAAALYDPLWVSTVHDPKDFAIALLGFVLLVGARWPSWIAVLWCVLATLIRLAWH